MEVKTAHYRVYYTLCLSFVLLKDGWMTNRSFADLYLEKCQLKRVVAPSSEMRRPRLMERAINPHTRSKCLMSEPKDGQT